MSHPDPDAQSPPQGQGLLRPLADRRRPVDRRTVLTAGGLGLGALAITSVAAAPRSAVLGERGGDLDLAAEAQEYLPGHRTVHLSVLTEESERIATFGEAAGYEFEIGSVTKTFTTALLASTVDAGALSLETTVAEVLGAEADGSAIADVTMTELAAHTSGLPRLVGAESVSSLLAGYMRQDPYQLSPEETVESCLAASPSGRGEFAYSNSGSALLGQLLARQLGGAYEELLAAHVIEPLGMASTRCPTTPEQLGENPTRGHVTNGFSSAPWTMHGHAPAGAVRSTIADMTLYVRGLLTGENPGAAHLDPLVERNEQSSQALGWSLLHLPEGEVVWHNGMTGGFASFCGIHRDTGRGVAIMTDTALAVEDLGLAVLIGEVGA